jgi:hypothetical protein
MNTETAKAKEDFVEAIRASSLQSTRSKTSNVDPCASIDSGMPVLLPHQTEVVALLHPDSAVQRLVVNHRVGSGKTLTMINVLTNFHRDPRTKIVVCPSYGLCEQFYKALSEAGTVYGRGVTKIVDHLSSGGFQADVYTEDATEVTGQQRAGSSCLFETKNATEYGPLIIVSLDYLDQLLQQMEERPDNPIEGERLLRRGMGTTGNPLSNKILIFDEFHVLFEPFVSLERKIYETGDAVGRIIRETPSDLGYMQTLLMTTFGTILGAFTATLPAPNTENFTQCVRVITMGGTNTVNLTGHLHTLTAIADRGPIFLQKVKTVKYVDVLTETKDRQKLCSVVKEYPDMDISNEPSFRHTTCVMENESDEVIAQVVNNLDAYAPKVAAMMRDLSTKHLQAAANSGTLILVGVDSGRTLVQKVLEARGISYVYIGAQDGAQFWYDHRKQRDRNNEVITNYLPGVMGSVTFWNEIRDRVATADADADITVGGPHVLILETTFLSEGLNLLGIDTVLGLSEFKSPESLVQAYGRADRMCTSRYFRHQNKENKLRMTQYAFHDEKFVADWKHNQEDPVGDPYGTSF